MSDTSSTTSPSPTYPDGTAVDVNGNPVDPSDPVGVPATYPSGDPVPDSDKDAAVPGGAVPSDVPNRAGVIVGPHDAATDNVVHGEQAPDYKTDQPGTENGAPNAYGADGQPVPEVRTDEPVNVVQA